MTLIEIGFAALGPATLALKWWEAAYWKKRAKLAERQTAALIKEAFHAGIKIGGE